jgi:hypothetical protein
LLGIDPHIIDLKGRWKSPFTKYNYVRLSDELIVERSRNSIPYWKVSWWWLLLLSKNWNIDLVFYDKECLYITAYVVHYLLQYFII